MAEFSLRRAAAWVWHNIGWLVALPLLLVVGWSFLQRLGIFSEGVLLPSATSLAAGQEGREARMITVLPKDAIPAIFEPRFVEAAAAQGLRDGEMVLGLALGGEARAYPTALLSSHEIVNDTAGGRPVAVTW